MKYWQKMLDMWKPLAADDEHLGLHALRAGYEIGMRSLSAQVTKALEEHIAHTKMKKKYRNGFLDATNMVYAVMEELREELDETTKPYWTAQSSYSVYDDYSVVKEWDSFGRNT